MACGLFHAWFIICIEWKFLAVIAEWVFAPYLGLEGEVPGGPLACLHALLLQTLCWRIQIRGRAPRAGGGWDRPERQGDGLVRLSPRFPPLAVLASVVLERPACCGGDTPPSRRFLALFVYLCETFGGVRARPP